MRRTVSLMAVMVAMLAASPARAQAYDPAYPICLQTYGFDGNYIACGYTSMDQCRITASGRAAQCIVIPYFGQNLKAPGRTPRRGFAY
jgi:Protein of unknown function (DUF3551)